MFHNVEQNTDEWFDLRVKNLTGSAVKEVMANYGKAFGDPAKKRAISLAREFVTGRRSLIPTYSSKHMERGHEQEPIARRLYEESNFLTVKNGGFFERDGLGCSPDGLVFNDGLIEIKSVIDTVHYKTIERGGFDPAYKWQIYFNLKVTGRDWIDFISYCADYPKETQLYVFRTYFNDCGEFFEMIDVRLREFFVLVDNAKNKILGN